MPRAPQRVERDPARQSETVSAAAPPAPVAARLTPAALLGLQRTAGNAAVARMLARATPEEAASAPPAAAAARLPSADELTARIATAIGVYETNRGGDEPNAVESHLDTAAGVSASMATIEQATMGYSLTTLKQYESLRQKASPELTMKELNDAEGRCIAVAALLEGVDAAARRRTTPDDYIKANAAAMESTGMGSDDVKRMFDAAALKAKVDAAHAKGTGAAEAAEAIPEAERVGMDTESLASYIADPRKWGENEAAWQRLAVQRMPGDIATRIEAVAESDGGTGLVGPVTRTRVDAQLGKTPQPSEEALVKAVAAQNNPGAKGYADGVWAVYQRLPAPAPAPGGGGLAAPRPVPGLY